MAVGKGTLIPVYHQGSTQAEHGLNPEVEMLCAEHKHTGRACKACEGTETVVEEKGDELLLFDVALDSPQLRWELHRALLPLSSAL